MGLGLENENRNTNQPRRRYYLLRVAAQHTSYVKEAIRRRLGLVGNNGHTFGYQAFLPHETPLEPGDITVIAYKRRGESDNNFLNFINLFYKEDRDIRDFIFRFSDGDVPENNAEGGGDADILSVDLRVGRREIHCDIVTDIFPDYSINMNMSPPFPYFSVAVGGNLQNSVRYRLFQLNNNLEIVNTGYYQEGRNGWMGHSMYKSLNFEDFTNGSVTAEQVLRGLNRIDTGRIILVLKLVPEII